MGCFEDSSFPNEPKALFFKEKKISVLLDPIKHIPLPHPCVLVVWGFFLKVVYSTYVFFVPHGYLALSYFLEG